MSRQGDGSSPGRGGKADPEIPSSRDHSAAERSSTPRPWELGLVLSGGGARGAYQLGCWRACLERGLSFAAVSGTSIGALNATLVAQGSWRSAHDLWLEFTRVNILVPEYDRIRRFATAAALDLGLLLLPIPKVRLLRVLKYAASAVKFASRYGALGTLRRFGLLELQGVRPLLARYLELSRVLAGSVDVHVTVSPEPTAAKPLGVAESFRLQDLSEMDAWQVLAASMALPLIFGAIEIDGRRYVDGGLGEWLPISPLYDRGFRRLVVVSTKSGVTVDGDAFPGCAITLIQPDQPLGRFPVATFRFTRRAVTAWIEQGYVDAHRALDAEFPPLSL